MGLPGHLLCPLYQTRHLQQRQRCKVIRKSNIITSCSLQSCWICRTHKPRDLVKNKREQGLIFFVQLQFCILLFSQLTASRQNDYSRDLHSSDFSHITSVSVLFVVIDRLLRLAARTKVSDDMRGYVCELVDQNLGFKSHKIGRRLEKLGSLLYLLALVENASRQWRWTSLASSCLLLSWKVYVHRDLPDSPHPWRADSYELMQASSQESNQKFTRRPTSSQWSSTNWTESPRLLTHEPLVARYADEVSTWQNG